jgi:putative ABC transport system permease protein
MLSFAWQILKLTIEEFSHNKVRTFLSLLGIAIGIFCIIAVQATTNSLEYNVRSGIDKIQRNTIFVQRTPWGGDPSQWWKYQQRPQMTLEEAEYIQKKDQTIKNAAFVSFYNATVEYGNQALENVVWYGVSDQFDKVQDVEIVHGRYISSSEFADATNVVLIGYENALKLFEQPEKAVGRTIQMAGQKCQVLGVIKKTGRSLVGGWDFDNIVLVTATFCKKVANFRKLESFIIVQGQEGISPEEVKGDIRSALRAARRIPPKREDNFSLNDVTAVSASMSTLFTNINLGGWFIAFLALLVGGFGVANIMFVSVRERTSIIGLKKAIGAKKSTILLEFLLESAFLCLIGGAIGLIFVFPLTFVLSNLLKFNIFLSWGNILLSVILCIILGILSGIIPASIAAKMDPVQAIRSK